MENLQEGLHHARGYFLSGQLDQCQAVLAAMPLFAVEDSSILQWVKENNLILCNKSELKSGGPCEVTSDVTGNKPRSVNDLKLVQQKLKGIPASRRLCALELAVTYNGAMLALVGGACDTMEIKTKIRDLEQNIITCLQRYISIFEDKMDTEKNMSVVEHLNVIRQLDVEPEIALSMTLAGCSLSTHYLIDGTPGKAWQLLDTLTNLGEILTNQEKKHGFSLLLKLPRQNLEVQLLKGGKDCFNPSIVVNLLRAFCYFCDDNYGDCLDILQPIDSLPTHILPVWMYMKSYCLYQEDSVMEAAQCLTDLVTTCSDNQLKARCHNLIACCLAKQNRLNSALQQFREALQQDFCYLEPLFNLSLVYRQQNLYDAELESLNLLVTALENSEASSEGDHRQTTEVILGKSAGVSLISVLYALSKRCLELKRYSIAAEKYLDLLSVLDESSVFSQASSMSSNLPAAGDMYLEAAFALFKSGQYEESLLICDQVISKATLPENFTGCHDQDNPQSTELLLSGNKSCPMSKESQLKLPNSSTDIVANFVDSSRTATGSRKRHRDDADSCGGQRSLGISQRSLGISQRSSGTSQMSSDIKDKLMVDTKRDSPKSKQLHLYCAALLLKSQCYRTVGKFSDIEALVDRVLAILEDANRMESVAVPSDDCGGSDTVESGPNGCEPNLKRRKLSEGKISRHCEYTSTSYQPIKDSLLELKAQACSDKALILIGQGNLQEAMKFLLRSLQCQPGNPSALFNYATLLFKMGRKQDSVAAFSKYRKIETNVERLTALESLPR